VARTQCPQARLAIPVERTAVKLAGPMLRAMTGIPMPTDAMCIEPQSAPPDALNIHPAIVQPGQPLIAEMHWTWHSLANGLPTERAAR
jgi:galactose mutarotase-like enzyme